MEWLSYLLVLLCPIMMLVCMRGHGSNGHKHHHEDPDFNKEIKFLKEDNKVLHDEIEDLSQLVKKGNG
jgi:hypothetical protein